MTPYKGRICSNENIVVRNYSEKRWIDSLSKLHTSTVSVRFCEKCNFLFKETEISDSLEAIIENEMTDKTVRVPKREITKKLGDDFLLS